MSKEANNNLKGAAKVAMHTGNIPSHNSPDGPVNGRPQTNKAFINVRDKFGNLPHPEPRKPVKYGPGYVSPFAPK